MPRLDPMRSQVLHRLVKGQARLCSEGRLLAEASRIQPSTPAELATTHSAST